MSQRELPVALVGAGLPTLPAMLRGAKPYAPRLFSYSDLARLSAASSRMLLVGQAALQQVSFEEDALELIISQSGGYPYFLQEYGRVLWDEVEQPPITRSDVVAVTELVDDGLDRTFFGPAFELGTDAEQRYLIGIAHLGDGPYRTADAATVAGYAAQGGASFVRDGLIDKELPKSFCGAVMCDLTNPEIVPRERFARVLTFRMSGQSCAEDGC